MTSLFQIFLRGKCSEASIFDCVSLARPGGRIVVNDYGDELDYDNDYEDCEEDCGCKSSS